MGIGGRALAERLDVPFAIARQRQRRGQGQGYTDDDSVSRGLWADPFDRAPVLHPSVVVSLLTSVLSYS